MALALAVVAALAQARALPFAFFDGDGEYAVNATEEREPSRPGLYGDKPESGDEMNAFGRFFFGGEPTAACDALEPGEPFGGGSCLGQSVFMISLAPSMPSFLSCLEASTRTLRFAFSVEGS